MHIKVCGMRAPANISSLAELKPEFMGFIFYEKSPRDVRTVKNLDLIKALPSFIKKVGVFVDEEIKQVFETAGRYELDYIQLHGSESPQYCHVVREMYKVIKVFAVDEAFDFSVCKAYQHHCDYLLFDTKGAKKGGNGLKFNWEKLKEYTLNLPFFLSGGIQPEDICAIHELCHPALAGLDLNSGFELEAGVKDIDKIKTFKAALV